MATLSTIHGHVLRDCRQIPWAGEGHFLIRPQSSPGLMSDSEPSSLSILLEKISLKHQNYDGTYCIGEAFVGPTTYIQFMHALRHIFSDKSKETNERVKRLTYVFCSLVFVFF